MTPSEIRAKETKDLVKMLDEKRGAMFGLRLQLVTGQLAKTAEIGKTRKDIARLMTILGEKGEGTKGETKTVKAASRDAAVVPTKKKTKVTKAKKTKVKHGK